MSTHFLSAGKIVMSYAALTGEHWKMHARTLAHHEECDFPERLVAEAGVECEDRDLDEAETGVVEDGGEPDDLHVGDEVVGAALYYVGVVAAEAMVDG
jgi:hypothetical protein